MHSRPPKSPARRPKDRGRNRVELFQDADQSIIRRHTDIMVIQDVRHALEHDRFRLEAQPILPLRGNFGRPRFELLIRMIDQQGANIPPSKFISAGRTLPVDCRRWIAWVIHHACTELGKHAASLDENIARFAINLSGQSCGTRGFFSSTP